MNSLIELAQAADGCAACQIAERRRNVVFGEGDPFSPLVLVGEGPGDQEDATGRPFVGRSGKLLDEALVAAGLGRERVYICNTVKCRACDWVDGKPINRPPTTQETQNCRRWLVPQLGLIRPRVILCIGAPSAKNLIKNPFPITRERGKYFPCEFADVAIASLHPAYILRNRRADSDGGYSLLVQDIERAWSTALRLQEEKPLPSAPHQQELL